VHFQNSFESILLISEGSPIARRSQQR